MANELTLNPVEQTEGLTADEQESLEIGERIYQEEQKLLAGKYQNAQDLEQAYLELQKKLGSRDPEDETEAPEAEDQEEQEPDEKASLYDQIIESYRKGEWDDEIVKQVEGMSSVDVANMFLTNQQQQQQYEQASSDDIEQIQGSIGGTKEYQNMIRWAGENLSEQEVSMYDTVMDRGDPLAMFFAAQALNARYRDAVGVDGQLLTGSAPRNNADIFRSQAQLVEAMNDPRYDRDPAYRQDVFDKLERSNLQF